MNFTFGFNEVILLLMLNLGMRQARVGVKAVGTASMRIRMELSVIQPECGNQGRAGPKLELKTTVT